jgi:hypothetical protein
MFLQWNARSEKRFNEERILEGMNRRFRIKPLIPSFAYFVNSA